MPTLGSIRAAHGIGGDQAQFMDQWGLTHRVSLGAFAGMSADLPMRVSYRITTIDRDLPALEPGEVLLKEYFVVSGCEISLEGP